MISLTSLLRTLWKGSPDDSVKLDSIWKNAAVYFDSRDYSSAALLLEELTLLKPTDLDALVRLAQCYRMLGRQGEAEILEERAFHLDDTNGILLYLQINRLIDRRQAAGALEIVRQARASNPGLRLTDYGAGRLCFITGRAIESSEHHLSSSLWNFDDLRMANAHLWSLSYIEEDEGKLAAEHLLWAETLISRNEDRVDLNEVVVSPKINDLFLNGKRRIRIGYWSSDFREHSVRYFFRPLLEGHDETRFEIFCYHDFLGFDHQTELIRNNSEHFFDVSKLSDSELRQLMLRHELDVLIELSGHTSNNRLHLLNNKLAKLQVTGIGYPPTTGLKSIDFKLQDHNTFLIGSNNLYAERPLMLRESFWCFDPLEEIEINYVSRTERDSTKPFVFACFGNAGKITDRMLRCWSKILERVPNSRLVIRSHHFADSFSLDSWRSRLSKAGLSIDQLDLLGPVSVSDLFKSYNDIDVILDTYPFNGGTTTCFATYMGVPVVSLFGSGLRSRMGLSILTSLGISELATSDEEVYIDIAAELPLKTDFLINFRSTARDRFKRSALGNGNIFAADLEHALITALAEGHSPPEVPISVNSLPPDELIKRAYIVAESGNADAAQRIVDYCLRQYPKNPNSLIFQAQRMASKDIDRAINLLVSEVKHWPASQEVTARINIIRFLLIVGNHEEARNQLSHTELISIEDELDFVQIALFKAKFCQDIYMSSIDQTYKRLRSARLIVPCENAERIAYLKNKLEGSICKESGWRVEIDFCKPSQRILTYLDAGRDPGLDLVLIVHSHIEIIQINILDDIYEALQHSHVVGFYGSSRWVNVEWRLDRFKWKAGSAIFPTTGTSFAFDLRWFGPSISDMVFNIAVLDGGLMATKPEYLSSIQFNTDLLRAGTLMEEYWAFCAFQFGLKLAVHQKLGVFISSPPNEDQIALANGRSFLIDTLNIELLEGGAYDHSYASLPAGDLDTCLLAMNNIRGPSLDS